MIVWENRYFLTRAKLPRDRRLSPHNYSRSGHELLNLRPKLIFIASENHGYFNSPQYGYFGYNEH